MTNEIVIAAPTFVPSSASTVSSDEGGALALKSLTLGKQKGIPVVVVDSGSTPDFISALSDEGISVLPGERDESIGKARQRALRAAAKLYPNFKALLFFTEPQKVPVIENLERLCDPILNNKTDLVIPDRVDFSIFKIKEKDLAKRRKQIADLADHSYRKLRECGVPPEQSLVESVGNVFVYSSFGRPLDIHVGPRVMNKKSFEYFVNYEGWLGHDWQINFVPVIQCIAAGLRVNGVPFPYRHPEIHSKVEVGHLGFTRKRLSQVQMLIDAMAGTALTLGLNIGGQYGQELARIKTKWPDWQFDKIKI